MTRLGKRAAEALTDALGGPDDELREALTEALRTVLDAEHTTPWADLVRSAAAVAGWTDERVSGLLDQDPEHLWDLAAELNERRALDP